MVTGNQGLANLGKQTGGVKQTLYNQWPYLTLFEMDKFQRESLKPPLTLTVKVTLMLEAHAELGYTPILG